MMGRNSISSVNHAACHPGKQRRTCICTWLVECDKRRFFARRAVSASAYTGSLCGEGLAVTGRDEGEDKPDQCAFIRFRFQVDLPSVAAEDLLNNGQAKSRAPCLAVGYKGLEDCMAEGFGDARPIVRDVDLQAILSSY